MPRFLSARRRLLSPSLPFALALLGCRLDKEPQHLPVDSTARAAANTVAPSVAIVGMKVMPVSFARGDTALPKGKLGLSIARGHALLAATHDSLPKYAPSALRCMSCHLDDGMRKNGIPLVGVYARFPQYRSRSDGVDLLEDRVNDCFKRSLNGRALAADSPEMHDIVAYLWWISRGIQVADSVPGQGVAKLKPLEPDTAHGRVAFGENCARCHGPDGQGAAAVPPLWGARSFNIGAGMARLRTAAGFIRYNMPFDKPGTLSDQDAFDIAAYVVSRPRPDFAGKANDWPNGDPPPDVAYPTKAAAAKQRAAAASGSRQHTP